MGRRPPPEKKDDYPSTGARLAEGAQVGRDAPGRSRRCGVRLPGGQLEEVTTERRPIETAAAARKQRPGPGRNGPCDNGSWPWRSSPDSSPSSRAAWAGWPRGTRTIRRTLLIEANELRKVAEAETKPAVPRSRLRSLAGWRSFRFGAATRGSTSRCCSPWKPRSETPSKLGGASGRPSRHPSRSRSLPPHTRRRCHEHGLRARGRSPRDIVVGGGGGVVLFDAGASGCGPSRSRSRRAV